MAKFSFTMSKTEKLSDALLKEEKRDLFGEEDDLTPEEIAALSPDEFVRVDYNAQEAERTGYSDYSYWRSTVRAFMQNKLAVAMLAVIAVILIFTFIQPYLPGQYDPNTINNDPETGLQIMNQQPNSQFWLGTNNIGQDMWARLWAGTRTSLFIGFTVALVNSVVGILLGMLWGYVRATDFFFTELYNVVSNIPITIIQILVSYVLNPSVQTIIVAMCFTGWLGMARFVRTRVLMIRDREFNLASRCLGSSTRYVIMKNLLPHMISVIILQFALMIPGAIGSEVFLTYIGLGIPLETPSLGNLVNSGRALMMSPSLRYQLIYPALILSIITVSFYMVGNAFADASDPKNHR
ncbi:MAG: ABC transporter permease [Lachnospiraceae bacterium]|nr:ABC transporter permease [Lachnospiraceae bacterium]